VASNNYIYKMSNAGGMSTITRYTDMLAGNPVFISDSYESIATALGTGSSNTITFTSIPSTYKHLQIRFNSFSTGAADWVNIRMNNDSSTSNYLSHRLVGSGSGTPTTAAQGTQPFLKYQFIGGSTTQASVGVIDILDHANSNKNKTVRTLTGMDNNGSGTIAFTSGLWSSTSAITRLDFILDSSNFATTTSFALYGIKG
jgi:hypothetical protein